VFPIDVRGSLLITCMISEPTRIKSNGLLIDVA
jgi:hypothetical protein